MNLKLKITPVLLKKTLGMALILFFSLSLFAAGTLAAGCSKGSACFHCDPQGQNPFFGAGTGPMAHGCPTGSCDFENSGAPAGLPGTIAAISADHQNVVADAADAADDFSGIRISNRFMPLPAFSKPAPTPPLYLLNLSLLC